MHLADLTAPHHPPTHLFSSARLIVTKIDHYCDENDHESLRSNKRTHSLEIVTQTSPICLQAFQKEDIDPLQLQLQDINSLGQGLIQTAANGTRTKKLEDDLEEVNRKWNTLNKKVPVNLIHAIKGR